MVFIWTIQAVMNGQKWGNILWKYSENWTEQS